MSFPFAALPAGVPPMFSPAYALNPQPTLEWLRTNAPVYLDPGSRMMVLTRYADCAAALKHSGLSAAGGQRERSDRSGAPSTMLNTDGAEHERLRRPASALLSPGAVRELRTGLAADLDALSGRLALAGGTHDVLGDLAEPIASATLARLLAITSEEAIAELDRYSRDAQVTLNPLPDPRTAAAGRAAMDALDAFLDTVVERAPAGTGVGALHADPTLSATEVKGVLSLCIVGGWSPLAEVFTSAVQAALAAESSVAMTPQEVDALVDDVLGWHTPIPFVARRAIEPVELPSGFIPNGAMVLVSLGAANHDPDRPTGQHLALGAGAHYCMGAALVRTAIPLAVRTVLTNFPRARVPAAEPSWQPGIFPRRVESLSIELGERAENTHDAA